MGFKTDILQVEEIISNSTIVLETLTTEGTTVTLNNIDAPTDVNASGGGLTLKGTSDKTILWDDTNYNWTSNQSFTSIVAGTVKATTDLLTLTNSGNAADMNETGTGILFNQYYYDGATPAIADSGKIAVITETDWTSDGATQDSYMSFQTALDGTVAEKMRIDSRGSINLNSNYFMQYIQNAMTASVNNYILLCPVIGTSVIISGKLYINRGGGSSSGTIAHEIDLSLQGYGTYVNCNFTEKIDVGSVSTYVPNTTLKVVTYLAIDYYALQITTTTSNPVVKYFSGICNISTHKIISVPAASITDNSAAYIINLTDGYRKYYIQDTRVEIQSGLTDVGAVLTLGTKEPTVVANDVLGRINFYAPLESDGSDAILTGASIVALAEDTFSATVNKTALVFQTGASEVATEKMRITSAGKVGIGTVDPANNLEVLSTDYTTIRVSTYSTALATSPNLLFVKSHNATAKTNTTTLTGEVLGYIECYGINSANGAGVAAKIQFKQNGTAGASTVPTNILFYTATDSVGLTERMRISSGGNVTITTADDPQITLTDSTAATSGTVKYNSTTESIDFIFS